MMESNATGISTRNGLLRRYIRTVYFIYHLILLQVDMTLKLWRSGFSIDDGPLRDYKDPANQEFLGSIKKG